MGDLVKLNKVQSGGYRLHLQRLRLTGESAIRTIKYPLKSDDNTGALLKLTQAIKNDYENLYGPLNLQTYHRNKSLHSLRDFWLDCLRCGAVICPSEGKILDTLRSLSGSIERIDNKQQEKMRQVNPQFLSLIDFSLFKDEVLLSSVIKSTKKGFGFFLDKEDHKSKALEKEMLQATVGIKAEQQTAYWLENYGADKRLYQPADDKLVTPIFLLPDIPFEEDEQATPIELITKIERYLVDKLDSYQEKQIINYLGPGNNATGLSATFNKFFTYLKDGDLQQIEAVFDNMAPGVWRDRDELRRRLEFLSASVKALADPSLVKTWADYRSDFGGKLKSWISNGLRQDDIIRQHLFGQKFAEEEKKKDKPGHLDRLNEIRDKIEASKSPFDVPDYQESITEIKDIVQQMIESLHTIELSSGNERINVDQLEDYRYQLGALRSKLNELHYKVCGDSEKDRADNKYKQLFKDLPRIPSFLGDVKIAPDGVYDKYLDSVNRVKRGIQLFKDVDRLLDDSPQSIPESQRPSPDKHQEAVYRFLQSLLKLAQINDGKISPIADQIIRQTLAVVGVDVSKYIEPKYYIFKPPQARRRGQQISLKQTDDLLGLIPELLAQTKIKWNKYDSVNHLPDWLGFIEITKIRLSLASQTYDMAGCQRLLTQEDIKNYFPKVSIIFNRYPKEKHADTASLNTVIQQAICSEMRGTASKMTTEKIINRWVVQPIDSEKKFPIVTDAESKDKPRQKGQNYYIQYPSAGGEDSSQLLTKNIFKQKDINDDVLKQSSKIKLGELIPIQSSKYQTQFLDNSLFSKKWAKVAPQLSSYSFIYEETSQVSWDDKLGCQLTTEKDSGRLFVAIPFKLSAPPHKYPLKNKRWSKFLGVDIGEYGVGTYILNAQNFQATAPTKFIYSPALRIIKESIKENKKRQKAGTFSIPNTYTKRLRDQAITSIRNQLHSIVVHQRARPVYEWQVSGFESGSGKVAKIYHSVKRADTGVGSGADDLERTLVWGTKFGLVGKDVDAYATSYNCSNCCESVYAYIHPKDDEKKPCTVAEVISSDNQDKCVTVARVSIDGAPTEPQAYIEDDKTYKQGDSINGKKVVEAIRKFSRPPLNVFFSRQSDCSTNLATVQQQLTKETNFEAKAGAQAIFMCPFCDYVSDADIQAAMWIALKGYLDTYDEWRKIKSGSSKEKIRLMLDFAKDKKIQPIAFDLSKRYRPKRTSV